MLLVKETEDRDNGTRGRGCGFPTAKASTHSFELGDATLTTSSWEYRAKQCGFYSGRYRH